MSINDETTDSRHALRVDNLQGESVLDSRFDHWIKEQHQPIALFDNAIVEFKNNRKTRAALIEAPFLTNNDRCFYKAFHSPSLPQRIYHHITSGRARRTFSYSLQLLNAGINVPQPFAYLESGITETSSFYFCEAKNSSLTLNQFIADDIQPIDTTAIFFQIGKQLAKLHSLDLQHGDFKWGNILIDANSQEICLVDLDAICSANINQQAKDLARFLVNSEERNRADSANKPFLAGYAENAPLCSENILPLAEKHQRKITRKHQKKYPHRYQTTTSEAQSDE